MQGLNVISHHFIGGAYAKQCVIKDGFEVSQHVHNFDHMSILAQGCAIVWQGETQKTYFAPAVIEIKANVAHSVQAVNGDCVWFCIHKTDETDESKIDDVLIKPFTMFDTGIEIDTRTIMAVIDDNPSLWNRHTLRTESIESPHYGCDDIWVRFDDENNVTTLQDHGEHESVWYVDSGVVKETMDIVKALSKQIPVSQLGGILITRIPAGGGVLRHSDAGRWHAEHYKDKYLISLRCDNNQSFCYDNEKHITQVNHVYKFNNLAEHWVENDSTQDRISLIICTRHN